MTTKRMFSAAAKFAIAAYLNVPVYAEFHRWLGRGDQLQGMWDAWKAGDRKAALAAFKAAEPVIMRAAQRGVVHKNNASRKVSRLAHRIAKLGK